MGLASLQKSEAEAACKEHVLSAAWEVSHVSHVGSLMMFDVFRNSCLF